MSKLLGETVFITLLDILILALYGMISLLKRPCVVQKCAASLGAVSTHSKVFAFPACLMWTMTLLLSRTRVM